jgi:CRISPR-associated protein Csd1
MINALLEYAASRGLASRPGYSTKTVKWIIELDEFGKRFTSLVTAGIEPREFHAAPELGSAVKKVRGLKRVKEIGGANSNFLIESLGKILGNSDKEETAEKARQEAKTFRWMLREAGYATLAETLSKADVIDQIATEAKQKKAKLSENATLRIGSDFLVDTDTWHSWWDSFRGEVHGSQTQDDKPTAGFICFGTGEVVAPVNRHLGLSKRLLGDVGAANDTPLITFDKPAFRSYHLGDTDDDCGRNAAMAEPVMKAYVEALRALFSKSIRIGYTRVSYWYVGPTEGVKEATEEVDVFAALLGGPLAEEHDEVASGADEPDVPLEEARLKGALDRVNAGGTSGQLGSVRFCTLMVSGAGGRVMTRGFATGSLSDLAIAVDRWETATALVGHTNRTKALASFNSLLLSPIEEERSLSGAFRQKNFKDRIKSRRASSAWLQRLWSAASTRVDSQSNAEAAVVEAWGLQIPESAVGKALTLHTAFVQSGKLALALDGSSDLFPAARAEWLSKTRLRLGLLKAYLIRNRGITMQPALDPEHDCAAYHCGRLLAVYDNLQRAALGDVGAGVIQRYYGGALTNPSGVFGQLSRMAQTHLSKLGGGLANLYAERIADIHNGIRKQGDHHASYPPALGQDEQAMFALGFWHQIAFDNAERARNTAAKKARDEAQEAQPEEEDHNE